jgi:hypothetical protein
VASTGDITDDGRLVRPALAPTDPPALGDAPVGALGFVTLLQALVRRTAHTNPARFRSMITLFLLAEKRARVVPAELARGMSVANPFGRQSASPAEAGDRGNRVASGRGLVIRFAVLKRFENRSARATTLWG